MSNVDEMNLLYEEICGSAVSAREARVARGIVSTERDQERGQAPHASVVSKSDPYIKNCLTGPC